MESSEIEPLPKAVVHEHLDGGLRVGTILELSDVAGHRLPANDEASLADWFHQGDAQSLEEYLEAFEHTIAVMQTQEAIARIAAESVHDLAADGVVYAEIRFDPGLCTRNGLTRHDVLEAALDGMNTAAGETGVDAHLIATALRHQDDSELVARAAVDFSDHGVVGFDLAGPEAGNPPDRHMAAIKIARAAGLGLSLHAGEGDGPHSVWRAIVLCGAQRIAHGVRLVDGLAISNGELVTLPPFPRSVRDHRVPLEVAITSNVHTGTYDDVASHPLGAMFRAGFNVSINTDNRLMSGVTLSDEYAVAATFHDLTLADLGTVTINALESGFGPWPRRRRLIEDVVKPAYGLG